MNVTACGPERDRGRGGDAGRPAAAEDRLRRFRKRWPRRPRQGCPGLPRTPGHTPPARASGSVTGVSHKEANRRRQVGANPRRPPGPLLSVGPQGALPGDDGPPAPAPNTRPGFRHTRLGHPPTHPLPSSARLSQGRPHTLSMKGSGRRHRPVHTPDGAAKRVPSNDAEDKGKQTSENAPGRRGERGERNVRGTRTSPHPGLPGSSSLASHSQEARRRDMGTPSRPMSGARTAPAYAAEKTVLEGSRRAGPQGRGGAARWGVHVGVQGTCPCARGGEGGTLVCTYGCGGRGCARVQQGRAVEDSGGNAWVGSNPRAHRSLCGVRRACGEVDGARPPKPR